MLHRGPRPTRPPRFAPGDKGERRKGFHNGCFFAICGAGERSRLGSSSTNRSQLRNMKTDMTQQQAARADLDLPPLRSPASAAWDDLAEGISKSWMWSAMAMQDITMRYRGSLPGCAADRHELRPSCVLHHADLLAAGGARRLGAVPAAQPTVRCH